MSHPIALRPSCLIERAEAIATGFDRIGLTFSAEVTRSYASHIKAGMPAALYEHQIGEQAARLASKGGAL